MGDDQADLSRLSNVLKVVAEVNERCWRGDDCELCDGVREGVGELAAHTQSHSDILEQRVSKISNFQTSLIPMAIRHGHCSTARWRL